MKPNIIIKATLVERTVLRLFLVPTDAEVWLSRIDPDSHVDIPLQGQTWNEERVKALIKRLASKIRPRKKADTYEEMSMDRYKDRGWPVFRLPSEDNAAIWAYQVVKTSTISDMRHVHGHPPTKTVQDTALLSLMTIIMGELMERREADELEDWLRKERAQDCHNPREFWLRFISANAMDSFKDEDYQKSKQKKVIKVGPATFFAFNPKTMKFDPGPNESEQE